MAGSSDSNWQKTQTAGGDILKWAIERKLPYFATSVEIKKQLGSHSKARPISVSRMFRPIHVVSPQKLESMAADIAHKIQLELPPKEQKEMKYETQSKTRNRKKLEA
ncbi:TATA box-binding protein-associated factor RNA polymerase I subunit B [Forsythia ovata]|uniref:TATA box-binding protein-associated factor RNA polymerase I subunit B n=1 Tax=Forsythia ovata TaxID=205694 RepID=A0ABD1P2H6_9LAMI